MQTFKAAEIPAEAYQLGKLRQDFRLSRVQLAACIATVIILLVTIGGLGLLTFPRALAPQNGTDWVCLAGIVMGVAGVGGWGAREIRKLIRNRHMRVLIFEEGLVAFQEGRVFVCRWDEIAWVRDEVLMQNDAFIIRCTVMTRSGQQWSLRNDVDLTEVPRILDYLINETKQRLVPRLLAELEAGQVVEFGDLKLSPEGVVHGERVLPWAELKSIASDSFRVTIEQRGAWVTWGTVPNGAVPNRFVLVEVAETFRRKAVEGTILA
jgi:hypothetical protein